MKQRKLNYFAIFFLRETEKFYKRFLKIYCFVKKINVIKIKTKSPFIIYNCKTFAYKAEKKYSEMRQKFFFKKYNTFFQFMHSIT